MVIYVKVDHFNTVLETYPHMRRTMESVAAERLVDVDTCHRTQYNTMNAKQYHIQFHAVTCNSTE